MERHAFSKCLSNLCSCFNQNFVFKVNASSTFHRLSKNLDVAKLTNNGLLSNGTSLSLNISATDYGEIRRSSLLALRINIIDINEENPYFNATVYNVFVMENIPVGSSVLKVEARKSSLSKSLSYGFVGQPLAYFDINQKTVSSTELSYLFFCNRFLAWILEHIFMDFFR